MSSKRPFINETLFFLNCAGLNPKNQTKFSKIRTALALILGSITSTLILLEVILKWDGVDSLLEGSDSFVAGSGTLLKIVFLTFYNRKIGKLLEDINNFWPMEEMEETVQKDVKMIYNFIGKFRIGISISYWTTFFVFHLKPIFTKGRTLPVKFYQPIDLLSSPQYEVVYLLQCIDHLVLLTVMTSVNFLFITVITYAVCELKALKYKFANLKIDINIRGDDERTLEELSNLIKHHSSVLGLVDELNNVFSSMMLTQFLASMFSICLGLFSLSGQGFPPKPSAALKYALFLISYVEELFIYCIGGDLIVSESLSVANEVYKSGWWMKTQPKLRKSILLVMLRAQKPVKITVGGMLTLNLECFTTVVRTAFSFFTFMQAMQIDESQVTNIKEY